MKVNRGVMVMEVKEALRQVQEVAKVNQGRDDAHKTRVVKDLKVGECYRQGDLYIFKVADNHPVGQELKRRQLADGESIGQRHTLVGDFKVYQGVKAPEGVNELQVRAGLGYAFDVLEGGALNTHPEHDNFKLECPGRYQVMHQVDLRTLDRVAD